MWWLRHGTRQSGLRRSERFASGAIFGLVVWLAGAAGCGGGAASPADPCANVECSGHGQCALAADGTAECQCDAGYQPIGLTCVEVTVDPCVPNPCTEPPVPNCVDAHTRGEAQTPGSCTVVDGVAQCDFVTESFPCEADEFCREGVCVTIDVCNPNPCTNPPAAGCDGTVQVTAQTPGVCAPDAETGAAACTYDEERHDCALDGLVCEAGLCTDGIDPCIPNPCTDPDPPSCVDAEHLLVPTAPGTCVRDGDDPLCTYAQTTELCPRAEGRVCSEGACRDIIDPCDPNPCFTPPAATCEDQVAVSYPALGTCTIVDADDYTCDYPETRDDCALAVPAKECLDGRCTNPDDPCDPNPCTNRPTDFCDTQVAVRFSRDTGLCTPPAVAGGEVGCDYGRTEQDCAAVAGQQCIQAQCVAPPPPPPGPGEVIVTEILYDAPGSISDDVGEWFEIRNVAAGARDIAGLTFVDGGTSPFSLTSAVPIPLAAGEHYLLARTADLGVPAAGIVADKTYTAFQLGNTADLLRITLNGVVIDEVNYDEDLGWPNADGAALSLSAAKQTALENDLPGAWCLATTPYAGDPEPVLGTPRAANPQCVINPCAPNPCTTPPAASCDGDVAVHPTLTTGACTPIGETDFSCDYALVRDDCVALGGRCVAGACDNTPPSFGPGELIVTEIMANSAVIDDNLGEWFEVQSVADGPRNLAGLKVEDGGGGNFTLPASPPLIVAAGARWLFARDATLGVPEAGITADSVYSAFGFNNSEPDGLRLTVGDTLIDEVLYDPSAAWPIEAGRALSLDSDKHTAALNDARLSWCGATTVYDITNGNAGTPGEPNPDCPPVDPCQPNPCNNPPAGYCNGNTAVFPTLPQGICTATSETTYDCDYAEATQDCSATFQECTGGMCGATTLVPPLVGEVIVVEIMYNPTEVDDAAGEWFELLSLATVPRNITDMTITDAGGGVITIDPVPPASLRVLEPGERLLVARAADLGCAGSGIAADVVHSDFGLNNGSDSLTLAVGDTVIDVVAYEEALSWPVGTGASISLDPDFATAAGNDDPDHWCTATTAYATCPTVANLGTPGSANAQCPEPPEPILPGELVVTEIMANPATATDQDGEWFEVYNAADHELDLRGLVIVDDGGNSHTVAAQVLVPVGAYAVLARLADPLENGGLEPDYAYGSSITLGNTSDAVILRYDGLEIDAVRYDSSAGAPNRFPSPANGHSIRLSGSGAPPSLDNSLGSNWCVELLATYSEGEYGTPGAANAACP